MKIRSLLAATVLAGGLAAVPGSAMAAPNFVGPSGYILTPDTTVTPHACVNGAYHWFGQPDSIGLPDFSTQSLNIGFWDRVEIGGTRIDLHGLNVQDTFVNAKVTLFKPDSTFQLAGGVMNAFDDPSPFFWFGDDVDRAVYVVGSVNAGKYLRDLTSMAPRQFRVGAGWGTGGFVHGLFVNGSFMVGKHIEVMGEWFPGHLGDHGPSGMVNGGLRLHTPVKGLAVDVAGISLTQNKPTISAGASYTWCFGCDKKKKKDDKAEAKPATVASGKLANALRVSLRTAQ